MTSAPTHYEVLNLPPAPGQPLSPTTLKAAFHAALLAHHPDKAPATAPAQRSIDAITLAYRTLRDAQARAAYDRLLLVRPGAEMLGAERVDLDEMAWDEPGRVWFRACRCGLERGYVVGEGDLEAEAERGEVGVPCAGCSLMLRVLFQAVEGG